MAATQGHGVQDINSHDKEYDVIDLSILPRESDDVVAFNQGGSTTAAEVSTTSTTDDSFRGLHLKDFDVGERLGAKRDGGGGYQVRRLPSDGVVLDACGRRKLRIWNIPVLEPL